MSDVLLWILFATVAILHAKGLGVDTTTGPMCHVGDYNLVQFRVNSWVRNFSTDHIIYLIRGDPVFCN